MQNRQINYNNYDEVKTYAQELVNKDQKGFVDFLKKLHASSLTPDQKFDCLSVVSTDNDPWTLGMTVANYDTDEGLPIYFDILEDVMKKGISKIKIFDLLKRNSNKTHLNIGIIILQNHLKLPYELSIENYFKILNQLLGVDNAVSYQDMFDFISQRTTTQKYSLGSKIAAKCNEKGIQSYLEFQINLLRNKISMKDMQNLNDQMFINNLIANKNATAFHFYQLIKYELISSNQIELIKKQPGMTELIEKEKQKELETEAEKNLAAFKDYSYEDFKKHAVKLLTKDKFEKNEFSQFLSALENSTLLNANKKMDVLSTSHGYNILIARLLKFEQNSFEEYILLIKKLIREGVSAKNLHIHLTVRTTSTVIIYLLGLDADKFSYEKQLYLELLVWLLEGKTGTIASDIYQLLADQSDQKKSTASRKVASDGNNKAIQLYIDLIIKLVSDNHGITQVGIQKIHNLKSRSGETFLDLLTKNQYAKPEHFYQLIVNNLISDEQKDIAAKQKGVLEILVKNLNFNDLNNVKFTTKQLVIQDETSTELMSEFIYKLDKSTLPLNNKMGCLSFQSSDKKTMGSTIGHIPMTSNAMELYFDVLTNLLDQGISGNKILELLSTERVVDRKTPATIYLSSFYNTDQFIKLMIALKQHGIESSVLQEFIKKSYCNDRGELRKRNHNNDTIKIRYSANYIFSILQQGLFSKDLISTLCLDTYRSKEILLEYINNLPLGDKIQALINATQPRHPEHPLYTFFNIQRGFKKTSPKNGVLNDAIEELSVSMGQFFYLSNYFESNRKVKPEEIPPSIEAFELVQILLLRKILEERQIKNEVRQLKSHEKEVSKNLEQTVVEDLISFEENTNLNLDKKNQNSSRLEDLLGVLSEFQQMSDPIQQTIVDDLISFEEKIEVKVSVPEYFVDPYESQSQTIPVLENQSMSIPEYVVAPYESQLDNIPELKEISVEKIVVEDTKTESHLEITQPEKSELKQNETSENIQKRNINHDQKFFSSTGYKKDPEKKEEKKNVEETTEDHRPKKTATLA